VSGVLFGESFGLDAVSALLTQRARGTLVLDHAAELARHRQVVEADDLHWRGRAAVLER